MDNNHTLGGVHVCANVCLKREVKRWLHFGKEEHGKAPLIDGLVEPRLHQRLPQTLGQTLAKKGA